MTAVATLSRILVRQDHALWMLLQQVTVRGLLASKFLLAARYLGPEQMGRVGIAMLSLAIVESLSDTGLSQAIIQRQGRLSPREAGAVWTLQLVRGIALATILVVLAAPISLAMKVPATSILIAFSGAIPMIRNAINPGLYLVQRDRNFRQLSLYDGLGALIDLISSLWLIHLGVGAISILVGTVAGDSARLCLSWLIFKVDVKPTFGWSEIKDLTAFGKWVWGSSVVTLALNQLDKILVARFLGATEFGFYQVASRIAQLVVADGAVALGQYLFPTFAQKNRISRKTLNDYFKWVMKRMIPLEAFIALLLVTFAGSLIEFVLGTNWQAATPVLRIMTASMLLGGVIAIMVAYCRASGSPKIVTQAVFVQLLALGIAGPLLIIKFGSIGMATAGTLALVVAAIFFAKSIAKGFH